MRSIHTPLVRNLAPQGLIFLAAVVTSVAACTSGASSSGGGSEPPVASAATAPAAVAAEPRPDPSPVHGTTAPVTGTVAETMEAASYTYVRLTTAQGDQWAAIRRRSSPSATP